MTNVWPWYYSAPVIGYAFRFARAKRFLYALKVLLNQAHREQTELDGETTSASSRVAGSR